MADKTKQQFSLFLYGKNNIANLALTTRRNCFIQEKEWWHRRNEEGSLSFGHLYLNKKNREQSKPTTFFVGCLVLFISSY